MGNAVSCSTTRCQTSQDTRGRHCLDAKSMISCQSMLHVHAHAHLGIDTYSLGLIHSAYKFCIFFVSLLFASMTTPNT